MFSDACENVKCGTNAECVATRHVGQCKCKAGYIGNAGVDKGCRLREIACAGKTDCPGDHYCHKGICKSKNIKNYHIVNKSMNFISNSTHFFVDLCLLDEECESNEKCNSGQCINPCKAEKVCGLNAMCRTDNHITQCSCPYSFTGNQDVECVRSECLISKRENNHF